MANTVMVWRARAEGGIEWQKERIEKREWLRLIVRAWRTKASEGDEEEREEEEQDQAQTAGSKSTEQHEQTSECDGSGKGAGRKWGKAKGGPAKQWAPRQAMAMAKYTTLVVRTAAKHRHKAQSAAQWYMRWKAAKQAEGARVAAAAQAAAQGDTARTSSTPEHVHEEIGVCASVGNQTHSFEGGDNPGSAEKRVSGTANGDAGKRLGLIKLLRQATQSHKEQRKGRRDDKKIGNTKGIRLTMGINIVEALQRNERFGKWWQRWRDSG